MNMTGTCMSCGQTRVVDAEDQQEADRLATENCSCDNNLKKCRQLRENIEELCAERAKSYGFDSVDEDTIDILKKVGELCIFGYIKQASFTAYGTAIGIRQIKDGVSVTRKKVSAVKLEA